MVYVNLFVSINNIAKENIQDEIYLMQLPISLFLFLYGILSIQIILLNFSI